MRESLRVPGPRLTNLTGPRPGSGLAGLAAVQACKLHALGVERGLQVNAAAPSVAVTQAVADDSVT